MNETNSVNKTSVRIERCDYRSTTCSATGAMIANVWRCSNHLNLPANGFCPACHGEFGHAVNCDAAIDAFAAAEYLRGRKDGEASNVTVERSELNNNDW